MTWGTELDAFDAYLAAAPQSVGTRKLRRYYLERFAAGCNADGPWKVTLDDLAEFLGTEGWSAETRKSARQSLKALYTWGVHSGRIKAKANPALHLPRVRIPRALPNPTPDDKLMVALAEASDRDKLMVLLGAFAGLRAGEIARLELAHLVDDVIRVTGKGGHQRLVPMHPRVKAAVDAEVEQRRFGRLGDGYRYGDPLTPYLFPGQSGGHITPGAVGRILKRRLQGLKGHTLRHRFATRAYAGTRDIRAVQELMGHQKVETTVRYTKVPDDALRAAVEAA